MPTIGQSLKPSDRRDIRQTILQEQEEGRRFLYTALSFDEFDIESRAWNAKTEALGKDWVKFRGFANVGELDRYGEITSPAAFRKAIKTFLGTNAVALWMHDPWTPIGRYTHGEVVTGSGKKATRQNVGGLYIEGGIMPPTDGEGNEHMATNFLRWVHSLVDNKVVLSLSVGYLPKATKREKVTVDGKEKDVRVVTDLDLLEISLVSIPASQRSQIQAKSLAPVFGDEVANLVCDGAECDIVDEDQPATFEPCDGLRDFVAQQVKEAIETKEDSEEEKQAEPEEVQVVELTSLQPEYEIVTLEQENEDHGTD